MKEKTEYLPLGSVVVVSGGVKKYVIVARGLQVKVNGSNQFFDDCSWLFSKRNTDTASNIAKA